MAEQEQSVDLDGMTKAQLIAYAEESGITVDVNANKGRILESIAAVLAAPDVEAPAAESAEATPETEAAPEAVEEEALAEASILLVFQKPDGETLEVDCEPGVTLREALEFASLSGDAYWEGTGAPLDPSKTLEDLGVPTGLVLVLR